MTAEACQDFFHGNTALTPHLLHNVSSSIATLEKTTGKMFGGEGPVDKDGLLKTPPPLLLSVRSSTAVKLPGMTDTILNLGINDKTAMQLGKHFGNPK